MSDDEIKNNVYDEDSDIFNEPLARPYVLAGDLYQKACHAIDIVCNDPIWFNDLHFNIRDKLIDYTINLLKKGELKNTYLFEYTCQPYGNGADAVKWKGCPFIFKYMFDIGEVDFEPYKLAYLEGSFNILRAAPHYYNDFCETVSIPDLKAHVFDDGVFYASGKRYAVHVDIPITRFADHMSHEDYLQFVSVVDKFNITPHVSLKCTVFNKEGIELVYAKYIELSAKYLEKLKNDSNVELL